MENFKSENKWRTSVKMIVTIVTNEQQLKVWFNNDVFVCKISWYGQKFKEFRVYFDKDNSTNYRKSSNSSPSNMPLPSNKPLPPQ